jgi:TPR repeat protein
MNKLLLLIMVLVAPVHACAAYETSYVQQLRGLAVQGDGESQFALALLYEHGEQGVIRDPEQAAALFLQAGKAGIAGACLYLGIKFEHGNGIIQNQAEAARWYCCAATKDWAMAQFLLAGLYEKGKGVDKDRIKALAWYGLAEEQGYPGAREAITRITDEMSTAEREGAAQLRTRPQFTENCSGL